VSSRRGVDEQYAFGPAPGQGTIWTIVTKNGETKQSWGDTAFTACAHIGLNLGQVAKICAI
jgi:hypothetical protein